jgi:hypothetical protein
MKHNPLGEKRWSWKNTPRNNGQKFPEFGKAHKATMLKRLNELQKDKLKEIHTIVKLLKSRDKNP